MDARSGVYALVVSAALVLASGAMLSDDAMAQADDIAVQGDAAPVETDVAAVDNDVAAVQDEAVVQPVPKQKPAVADRPVKSNLNQSAVRAAPVTSSPRPTRTSTRSAAVPKILGSYR